MSSRPVPTPYVATPTTHWDGIDGNWSTFRISVGRQAGSEAGQDFRVLVSTGGNWPLVLTSSNGCLPQSVEDCAARRGVETFRGHQSYGFQDNQSHSWIPINNYNLSFEENLGLRNHEGTFGYDTVRLGFSGDANELEVNETLVVEYAEPDHWMGLLGLGNDTFIDGEPVNSFIRTLNNTGAVPSLSYGYTAGAYYRNPRVPGSLVIGGYDNSRFEPPIYNFSLSTDSVRYPVVGVQAVYTNFSIGTEDVGFNSLTSSGHFSVIDSTVSQLWLPGDVCDSFQKAFGLIYDEEKNYYLINDTTHDSLQAKNPSLTFRLGRTTSISSKDTILIKLPYAAFDHFLHYPAYVNSTRYFPIRRAMNSTQYTIGRVFLQEAYLTVDYERNTFSLAQAYFSETNPDPDIRSIQPVPWVNLGTSSLVLSSRAIAGIAIGATVSILLMLSIIYFYWWRPRRQAIMHKTAPELQPDWQKAELSTGAENQVKRPELDADNAVYELHGVSGSCELSAPVEGRGLQGVVYEMDASHELTHATREDNGNADREDVEGRTSEQMGASGLQGPSS